MSSRYSKALPPRPPSAISNDSPASIPNLTPTPISAYSYPYPAPVPANYYERSIQKPQSPQTPTPTQLYNAMPSNSRLSRGGSISSLRRGTPTPPPVISISAPSPLRSSPSLRRVPQSVSQMRPQAPPSSYPYQSEHYAPGQPPPPPQVIIEPPTPAAPTPPPEPRLRKLTRIIRKPPPRFDSTPPSDHAPPNMPEPRHYRQDEAEIPHDPLPGPSLGGIIGRARKRRSHPPVTRPVGTVPSSSDEESVTASFSNYPGRMQEPATSRVPVPLMGEEVPSHGGFIDDSSMVQFSTPRNQGPSAMEQIDRQIQQRARDGEFDTDDVPRRGRSDRRVRENGYRNPYGMSPIGERTEYEPSASDDARSTPTMPENPALLQRVMSPAAPYAPYPPTPTSAAVAAAANAEVYHNRDHPLATTAADPLASDASASVPSKPRGAVRFRLAGLAIQAAQRMSSGTANLARRTSLGSGSGSRRQSTATAHQPQSQSPGPSSSRPHDSPLRVALTRRLTNPNKVPRSPPPEPLATRLHAGPGGVFAPDSEPPNPVVRTLLERAASSQRRPAGWMAPTVQTASSSSSGGGPRSRSSDGAGSSQAASITHEPRGPPTIRPRQQGAAPMRTGSTTRARNYAYRDRAPLSPRQREREGSDAYSNEVLSEENPLSASPISDQALSRPASEELQRAASDQRRKGDYPLYRDPSYRVTGSRLRDPRQGPSSISHEGPTTEDMSHAHTYESSRPLVRRGERPVSSAGKPSRTLRRRQGGQFQRNVIGMEIFADPAYEPDLSEKPLSSYVPERDGPRDPDWEPIYAARRVLREVLYLPFRSKQHPTVTYLPPRSKPEDARVAEPWYTPRPPPPVDPALVLPGGVVLADDRPGPPHRRDRRATPGPAMSSRWRLRKKRSAVFSHTGSSPQQQQPVLHVIERDPNHHARYITQDQIAAGQQVQILSEDAPPELRSTGAPPVLPIYPTSSTVGESPVPSSTWFTASRA